MTTFQELINDFERRWPDWKWVIYKQLIYGPRAFATWDRVEVTTPYNETHKTVEAAFQSLITQMENFHAQQ